MKDIGIFFWVSTAERYCSVLGCLHIDSLATSFVFHSYRLVFFLTELHWFSFTKTIRLFVFREVMAVCPEDRTEHSDINTKMKVFWMLQQEVNKGNYCALRVRRTIICTMLYFYAYLLLFVKSRTIFTPARCSKSTTISLGSHLQDL